MALGPQKQKRESALRKAEAIIDKAIKASGGERATIDASLLPITMKEWPTLKRKYKQAGWKGAVWVTDQRDGDYIDLQA